MTAPENLRTEETRFTPKTTSKQTEPPKTRHAITIGREPDEVYRFWRDFRNLPRFMKDLVEVTQGQGNITHWKVRLKSGQEAEWDARMTTDRPGQMIAWISLEGSDVNTSGLVTFEKAPGDRGTVVSLFMDYEVPGGKLTEWLTFFRGEDPDSLTITNLKRLKAFLEVGEIATTEGQPSGRDEKSTTLTH